MLTLMKSPPVFTVEAFAARAFAEPSPNTLPPATHLNAVVVRGLAFSALSFCVEHSVANLSRRGQIEAPSTAGGGAGLELSLLFELLAGERGSAGGVDMDGRLPALCGAGCTCPQT